MKKIYTLVNVECNSITNRTGSIKYFITDDAGNKRVVRAKVKLGLAKRIKSVEPIFHRETPLVEVLSKTPLNRKFKVDFTAFNQLNPRPESSSAAQRINSQQLTSFQESYNKDFTHLSLSPVKMLKLTGIAVTGFALYHSLLSAF